MPKLSELAVRAFSSSVEFVLVEHARLDMEVRVRRELVASSAPEIASHVGLYRIPIIPEKQRQSLRRRRYRQMAALGNCCLPGMFAGLLILPKGNKPDFLKHMRSAIHTFRKATTRLKKSWKTLTSQAHADANDLLRHRYNNGVEVYRGPNFEVVAREFLNRFTARQAKGPSIVLPSWTFLQVLGSPSRIPRLVGYKTMSIRLDGFLSASHTKAVQVVREQLTFAVSQDPTAYAAPKDYQRLYAGNFRSLQVALWWQRFDTFKDDYSKAALSVLVRPWEKLRELISCRKRLAPGVKLAKIKKLTSKLRGSCLEALQRLASHPAVGSPPALRGGVK